MVASCACVDVGTGGLNPRSHTHIHTQTAANNRDFNDGCLLGRHIRSHKGKAHVLAERCRRVLSLAYEQGLLDAYYAVLPPPPQTQPQQQQAGAGGAGGAGGSGLLPPLLQVSVGAGVGGGGPPVLNAGAGAAGGGGVKRTGLLRPPGLIKTLKPPQSRLPPGDEGDNADGKEG